ncbi:RNA-dependent RNA polymerase [Penicillium aurantiogriseum partitivirus 1-cp]|nr:RNA-dependent RNA polymerase [Penicillium aurantiogriseum partitivirus 1-cp]
MSRLRFLRKVSRFPARNETHFDPYVHAALDAVSGPNVKEYVSTIQSEWHRPSGDNAILEDNLMDYGDILPGRSFDGAYLAILKKTLDELKPAEPIIPLTLGAAEKHPRMPSSTSPGFPWTTKGYRTKRDVFEDKSATGMIHRAWDSIGRGIAWRLPDCLGFHRTVASVKEKSKIRPVWGFPTDVIVEEARYFFPLWEELKLINNERDTFYGTGMETMLSGHQHLARNFDTPSVKYVLNSDLSRFDAHVPSWVIRDVFSHISSWFDFSRVRDSEGKIWNCNTQQTCRRWKAMVSYFINTKVRMPSGLRFQKSQGVPSGSMFTNLIDTCVNAVQFRTALYHAYGELPIKDYYYGDDSCIFLREIPDLEAIAKVLLRQFGAELNVDKTILSDNPDNIHWLGYYYRSTGPRRSLDFIIASSLYPDREIESPLDSAARLLGQLYSCMDPKVAVTFYDCITWLQCTFNITTSDLNSYVASLPSKAMKYLNTLGLETSEISLPRCAADPFGGRYIPDLLPHPCARNFFRFRDRHLPRFAFCAEAYQNRSLRQRIFKDLDKYSSTFNQHFDYDLDAQYFTD